MKKRKDKKLKIRFKFNDNISEDESGKIWFQVFDILLNEPNKYGRGDSRKTP